MARTQTMVQLSDEFVALLDRSAHRRGVSRSALVRQAIEELLAEESEAAMTAAIIDGYRRVPPGQPDEWGDLESAGETSAREVAQRLDAEEKAAGLPSW